MRISQVENWESSRKCGQVLEGTQERFLDRVFGIFPVMRDGLRDSEKSAVVSLYELLESGKIPFLGSVDKIQVIACHLPHYELCRVCSHIGPQRFGGQLFCSGSEMLRVESLSPLHAI
jgi:hypothetical protein